MIVRIVILVPFIFLAEVASDDMVTAIPLAFIKLAAHKVYVDKTGLLIDFISNKTAEAVYLSAPRRFGKTVNTHMIYDFLNIGFKKDGHSLITNKTEHPLYEFFKTKAAHLQAVQNKDFFEEHFGNYIVIKMSLNEPVEFSLNYTKSQLSSLIKHYCVSPFIDWWQDSGIKSRVCTGRTTCCPWLTEMFENHNISRYAEFNLKRSLHCLFTYLREHYNKEIILLVDEFDYTVLRTLRVFGHDAANDILQVLSDAFGSMSKDTLPTKDQYPVFRGLFTGITHLPVGPESAQMGNVKVYSYFNKHPLSQYYGFNQEEVDGLLERFDLQNKKDSVKNFYDGYKTIGADWQNYNPFSVSEFISSGGQIRSYWRATGTVSSWFRFCIYPEIFKKIEYLAQGKTVDLDIIAMEKIDDLEIMGQVLVICDSKKPPCTEIKQAHHNYFFRYLLQEGYLSPANSSKETKRFRAPNEEIKQEYCDFYSRFARSVIKIDINFIANMFWIMADTGLINDKHVDELSEQFNRLVQYRIENEERYHYNEQALRSLVYISCRSKIVEPIRNEFVFAEIPTVYQDFINLMQSDGVNTIHKLLGGKKYEKADVYLKLHDGKTIMIIKFKGDGNIEKVKDQVLAYRPREEDKVNCEKLVLVWVSVNRPKTLRDEIKVSVGCYIIENYNLNPDNPVARECVHPKNLVNPVTQEYVYHKKPKTRIRFKNTKLENN